MNIVVVSSSTRKDRVSHRVALMLIAEIHKRNHLADMIDLNALKLPPFEERLSHLVKKPAKLIKVEKALLAADGIIFLTPEYNGGISSGLKNFIDVFAKKPFEGKPIGVSTASDGIMGGIRAAYQLQQIVLSIFGYPIPRMLTVPEMATQMDENGVIINPKFQPKVDAFLDQFLEFTRKISTK